MTATETRWARTPRPHRVARGFAIVALEGRSEPTELAPAAAALFDELATPRTTSELSRWLGLADDSDLEELIAGLAAATVLVPDGPPAPGPRAVDRASWRTGADPRGVVLTQGLATTDPVVVDQPATSDLLRWARAQRVIPLLAEAVARGSIIVPTAAAARVIAADRAVQRAAVMLEAALLDVAALLATAGIGVVLLKGLATAHIDHPSPAWRQTSDIDLLLPPAGVVEATALLRLERGARLVHGAPLSSITKAVTVRMPSGVEVDLHARPVMLPYGSAELLPPEAIEIAGETFHALARPDRWAHAAAHYALSRSASRRASSLRDVLATWPTADEEPRWDDAVHRWRAATLMRVVEHDLAELGVTPSDSTWLRRITSPSPRWYERELVRTRTPGPLLHWAAPLAVLGWRPGARHLTLMARARARRVRPR